MAKSVIRSNVKNRPTGSRTKGRADHTAPSTNTKRSESLQTDERAARLDPDLLETVVNIAAKSAVAKHVWRDRTRAGIGYVKGMATVFASLYFRLLAGDKWVTEMAKAKTRNPGRDVVAWYAEEFEALGMDKPKAGVEVLRHLFVVMFGLGMKVSAGKYCKGRNLSVDLQNADSATAGLFQSSYALRSAHPLLPKLIQKYSRGNEGFLHLFREGVVCAPHDWENYGRGKAMDFQRLSKACPLFAVEFAAIALRHRRDHWDAINYRQVELLSVCDRMLLKVQDAVERTVVGQSAKA